MEDLTHQHGEDDDLSVHTHAGGDVWHSHGGEVLRYLPGAPQPKTLAEAKRMIARLREQNHAHAAKRDQQMRLLQRQVAKTRADFARARSLVADDFYDHFWKHGSFSAKYRLVDLLREAGKIDVERLTSVIDHHFDSCLRSHRDPEGVQEFAAAIAAEYEALA